MPPALKAFHTSAQQLLFMRRFLSTMAQAGLRRFAPLKEGTAQTTSLPKLRGIVFDVDGTLCEPQNHMFQEMRNVLSIPKHEDILDHVYALTPPARQEAAMEAIRDIERREMALQKPQPGLGELMRYLDSRKVQKAICTRNFDAPVTHLLDKFLPTTTFAPIITRAFRPPKPDPAGILFIARSWGLSKAFRPPTEGEAVQRVDGGHTAATTTKKEAGAPGEEEEVVVGDASGLIMVGDSIDDMIAGRKAGAATVLLVNKANEHLSTHECTDLCIGRLDELVDVLEGGFVGREIS